ncbi:hypothetical protein JOD67_001868 [Tenggerimyces flavus]|nr:hypothetical protein [Tenggerimyces flavus]
MNQNTKGTQKRPTNPSVRPGRLSMIAPRIVRDRIADQGVALRPERSPP